MWHARPATQWHARCALMQCVASLCKTFNEIGINKLTTETWRRGKDAVQLTATLGVAAKRAATTKSWLEKWCSGYFGLY